MKITFALLASWLAIIFIVLAYGYFVHVNFGWKWTASGVFGDSFGALNTVFAGMALTGLGINIWAQNQTQRHQQKEIEKQQQRLDAQERDTKIQRSFVLLNEWQSEPLHAARTAIHGLTNGLKSEAILSLSEYDEQQVRHLQPGGDREGKGAKVEQIRQLFTVLYFFEKLGFLLEADMLDVAATSKLFAEPSRAYGELIRTLLQKESSRGNEARQNWLTLLKTIDHRVLGVLGI